MARPKGRRNGERHKLQCINCGVTKETPHTTAKYCSHKCFTDHRRILHTENKVCKACEKTFINRQPNGSTLKNKQFCSRKCALKVIVRKKGYSLSEEHKKKIGDAQRGSQGNNWRGGITPVNKRLRLTPAYKLWRKSVFERDDYTCQFCGERGGELNADHIKPFSKYEELRHDVENGRTLCVGCHRTTDTYAKNIKYQK